MSMPDALANKRILLTRPASDVAALANRVAAEGGNAVCVPCLEAVALDNGGSAQQTLHRVDQFFAVVFISRNAVKFANDIIPLVSLTLPDTIIAPGKSTADSLNACGVAGAAFPKRRHDSDAILALSALQDVADKSILIVRGHGGLDTLRDKLGERGANVTCCEVYQRKRPCACGEMLQAALTEKVDAVCVASGETLRNLLSSTAQRDMQTVLSATLFVPSERVAAQARSAGFNCILVSASPDDAGFIKSLNAWSKSD